MGTKVEQNDSNNTDATKKATAVEPAAALAERNTTHTTTTIAAAAATPTQDTKTLPTHGTAPQVIISPAAQAEPAITTTTTTTTMATNAAKKIRRAFSMPRNPFRWSRKFKTVGAATAGNGVTASSCEDSGSSRTAMSSCVGGGRGRSGSIVSLNIYDGDKQAANAIGQERALTSSSTGNSNNTSNSNNNNKRARVMRRSSFRKFLNRIAQQLSATVNVGAKKQGAGLNGGAAGGAERVPPIGGYQWPADQTPGVMGLKNHGNTCFMNAVLQCLSHTDILAEYFVLDQYKADLKRRNKINSRKFGTKGELTEQLANVLKALWTCRNESDHSTSFKAVVDRYGSQFRSSTQHDAQEFLFWLLDKVHEDLNTASKRRYKSIKNSYGRSDEIIAAETLANHIRCNNSFVQAVFQAQFRSSLTCPRCQKQSNTFDPFHCISVQLPQLTQQTVFVTVVFMKQQPRQLKMGLRVPAGSPIVALREQLQETAGIAGSRMVLVDMNAEGFTRVFYDSQPVETLSSADSIYCIEMPEPSETPKASTDATAAPPAAEKAATAQHSTDLLLLVANVQRQAAVEGEADGKEQLTRFGAPFSMKAPRDCSYQDLQKRLLREMSAQLKPEVFAYATPLADMFKIRLQDPSADPDTFLEQVEHPLLTEMIDMALSVLSAEAGPTHIKLLLEWRQPETHFVQLQSEDDVVVEHESVAQLSASKAKDTVALTLEQCLEHYTKAETLSAEDAWRCPHCQQYLPVVKTLGLWSLPDILVVHFKRFRQHQSKGPQAAKLTTMVKFPLNAFDMSPHLARGVRESNNQLQSLEQPPPSKKLRAGDSRSSTLNSRGEQKDTRYDLYAVCYHQGDTLETGHYTAACKNPYDRQWYKFDDQRVSKVPEQDIEHDIINNEAYMLFYQRRSVDAAGECSGSGSSSNSGDHWVSRIAPPAVSTTTIATAASSSSKERDLELTEPTPEKAVSKPVAIPLPKAVPEIEELELTPPDACAAAEVLNIEELAYADADPEVDPVTAELESSTVATTVEAEAANEIESEAEVTQIFAMDEDCAEKLDTMPTANATTAAVEANVQLAKLVDSQTNGHVASSAGSSSTNSSAASSVSSLNSPRMLSTSVNAASTLQNKFIGHMSALLNGNHVTTQLSSSLQLSRQALQHNCHGSRSSVSAVESVAQQQQQAAAAASLSLRHSFSTSSNYKLRECSETLSSLLRNSANTCSKDTLLFIDQQSHHHTSGLLEDDDDDGYMGRSLWISPVTPHKLITVSPKN